MPRRDIFQNPFYVAIILAGASFGITAFATTLLAARAQARQPAADSPLTRFLDRRGTHLMYAQLGVLAAGVVGAFTTDAYWRRRAEARARAASPTEHAPARPSRENLDA